MNNPIVALDIDMHILSLFIKTAKCLFLLGSEFLGRSTMLSRLCKYSKRCYQMNVNLKRTGKSTAFYQFRAQSAIPMTNWFDRHFGIEIEMILPQQTLIKNHNDLHFHLKDNHQSLFDKWEIKMDKTLHIDENNKDLLGFEIISPKLLYNKQSKQTIDKICNILCQYPLNAYLNVSCGLHVHCDASNMNLSEMYDIAMKYKYFECIIDQYMNTSRRENNNPHCKSLQFLDETSLDFRDLNLNCNKKMDKYLNPEGKKYKLCFNALKSHLKSKTIENRHHMGSINSVEIINWIKFNLLFIHKTINIHNRNIIKFGENDKDECLKRKESLLWEFIDDKKLEMYYFKNKKEREIVDDVLMLKQIDDNDDENKNERQSFVQQVVAGISNILGRV